IAASGAKIPYPPATRDFHHEIELVVAIGKPGFDVPVDSAEQLVFGFACGLDMTRRDLQKSAREKGHPWSTAKDIEHGAIVAPIQPVTAIGHPTTGRIWLAVNGDTRQNADLADLIWSVPEIIAYLSRYYHLAPGDLIFSGTPAGVGPVAPGDIITGGIHKVGEIRLDVQDASGG
ncbi:MAG: fumarylacetoacetate hydrolase family protein, partial [Gammaproteobacteria bacterium]|nr:fumarylacetoacetate hydrolase family protein [Gammaproteobacteria bacterium]